MKRIGEGVLHFILEEIPVRRFRYAGCVYRCEDEFYDDLLDAAFRVAKVADVMRMQGVRKRRLAYEVWEAGREEREARQREEDRLDCAFDDIFDTMVKLNDD